MLYNIFTCTDMLLSQCTKYEQYIINNQKPYNDWALNTNKMQSA